MRVELYCPSCGEEVRPTLMPPPTDYTCEGCNETMPRTKLTKIKVLNRRIAGVGIGNNMTATVVGTGSFFDATQNTGSLTVSNCVFRAGDCCVACIAVDLAGGGVGIQGVTVGGLTAGQTTTGGQGDVEAEQWIRGNLTAGSKSVVITGFGGNPTACAMVVVAVSGARLATLPSDGFVISSGSGTAFDSEATDPLLFNFQMAIAMVGMEQDNDVSSWGKGFTRISGGHASTNQGGPPNDVAVTVASKPLISTDAVQATGVIGVSASWLASITTIRPS